MKNIKIHLSITAITLLFAAKTAYADMANGSYSYNSSGTVPVWDISGEYSGTLDGLNMDFTISQGGSGTFQGDGTFSYYDAWTDVNLSGNISAFGKVSGSAADPSVSMELLISGSGTVKGDDVDFTATARIKFAMDVPDGELVARSGSVSVTVTDLTAGKKASRSERLSNGDTFPLPTDTTGYWNMTLNLTPNGTKYTGTATIQTSTGGTMNFTAIGDYSPKTDASRIKLIGNGGALSLVVSTSGPSITVKNMRGKMYGQSVNYKAP